MGCIDALLRAGRCEDALIVCDQLLHFIAPCSPLTAVGSNEYSQGSLLILSDRASTAAAQQRLTGVGQAKKAQRKMKSQVVGHVKMEDMSEDELGNVCTETALWLFRAHALHGLQKDEHAVLCLKQ